MSDFAGQAAGLAVGAAVGSIVPGVGTLAGAGIGSAAAGFFSETELGQTQGTIDQAALNLNREQARLKAAETGAIHAGNFRKKLASKLSVASMRGGSGSVAAQVGAESMGSFLRDQRAIETGLAVSEAQGAISQADLSAKQATRDLAAATRFGTQAFSGVNLNLLQPKAK